MRLIPLATAAFALAHVFEFSSGAAIVRRHDVADAGYIKAAAEIRGLVHIDLSNKPNVGDGEGTLVGAQWVLTAAHVATELKVGHLVSIGTTRRAVDRVCMHPEAGGTPPSDMALLHLESPVTDEQPIPLYRGTDELNQVVWLAGYGDTGDGLGGPTMSDRRVRAATNRIDETTAHWLIFSFDAPTSPRVTALEGISGPGDSGGPAFLNVNGRLHVAGVSSRQDISATNGQEGRYGVRELYARVSTHAQWIDLTMSGKNCAVR